MKILKNKFLIRLITVICLFGVLFNLIGTTKVYAENETWGGVLIKPVIKLLTAIADGVIGALNRNIEEQSVTFIKVEGENNWWDKWGAKVLGIITGVIITAAIVVAIIGTGGAAAFGVGTTIKIAVTLLLSTGISGYLVADIMDGSYFPEDIYLPFFRVSLDRIFSDDIALLDVNFFEPNKYTKAETTSTEEDVSYSQKTIFIDISNAEGENQPDWTSFYSVSSNMGDDRWRNDATYLEFTSESELDSIDWNNHSGGTYDLYDFKNNKAMQDILNEINKKQQEDSLDIIDASNSGTYTIMGKSYKKDTYDADGNIAESKVYNILKIKDNNTGQFKFTIKYNFSASGEEYIPADITIIREAGNFTGVRYEENDVEVISTAAQLQEVVATWYFILRNVALLVLILVLIYSGIRIVVGSTAGEKAKYKERLMDWIVAICLIFIMHYIMVFAVEIVEKINDLVGAATVACERGAIIKLTDAQYEDIKNNKPEIASQVDSTNGNKDLYWNTDLMGEIKIYSQQEKEGTENWVGMAIAYVVLVFYTVFFIRTYLKRVLYMAFLTMISPLVAMTYPIDKINDGKAQAFNMWFKEYIFNLLIQPMQLLLYNILVVSAYELAATSTIYTLVAIGFMVPAEKLIRKFFGFEKAQTPGLLGGAAGAALAMTGIQNLMRHHPKGKEPERYKNKEESNNVKQFSSKEGIDVFGTLSERGEGSGNEETIELGTKVGEKIDKKSEPKSELGSDTRVNTKSEKGFEGAIINEEIPRNKAKVSDEAGKECYSSGVTEVDDMLAIKSIMEKEDKDKRIPNIKEAIAATKLKNQLPQKISSMTSDKVEKYEKTYAEAFKQKLRKIHANWDEEHIDAQAQTNAKILIKDMKNLESAKSELTKV